MTERQKVADLPQEERELLLKRATDAGIRNAMIATWYVDTLEAKIAAATAKKDEGQGSDDAAPGADKSQQAYEQAEEQDDETPTDEEQKADETLTDVSDINPKTEADELDKDVEPPAPVAATPVTKTTQTKAAKTTKEANLQVVKICHICRGKVINGKCTSCGFEISKR